MPLLYPTNYKSRCGSHSGSSSSSRVRVSARFHVHFARGCVRNLSAPTAPVVLYAPVISTHTPASAFIYTSNKRMPLAQECGWCGSAALAMATSSAISVRYFSQVPRSQGLMRTLHTYFLLTFCIMASRPRVGIASLRAVVAKSCFIPRDHVLSTLPELALHQDPGCASRPR